MYDRIPFIKLIPRSNYKCGMPRVLKWYHKKESRQSNDLLPHFRGRLDLLRAHEVYWDNTSRGSSPVSEIALYNKYLKYLDIVKPHKPDQVLRQMGYVQGKPKDPFRPLDADRSSLATSYSVKYTFDVQF